MDPIQPTSILATMVFLQAILFIVMMLGVALDRSPYSLAYSPQVFIFISGFFLVHVLVLVFSDELYKLWSPMLGDLDLPSLPWRYSRYWVTGSTYVVVTVLIGFTGGKHSPLMPILFLLPTVSIFLRDGPTMTVAWGILSAVYYLLLSFGRIGAPRFLVPRAPLIEPMNRGDNTSYAAHRIVALACLGVTIIIGYITRPTPVI